jgi:NAD(P)-dependent dehydrogenase (short-subunit alcohol dehydrogenase family)
VRLAGQHAVVTGGGTGIGAAIADALAAEGANITLVGRRLEKLEETAQHVRSSRAKSRGAGTDSGFRPSTRLGTNEVVFCTAADVSDRAQVDAAFAAARAANGPVSILVANAGAAESAPFGKTSLETWRRMLAVNLDGVFHACQAALPDLVAAGRGRIVTIASTAGLRGYAYSAAYGTAKHAAVGLTRMIAADYAGTALTANAVCPGFTDTDLVDNAATRVSAATGRAADELKAQFGGFNPSGRLIAPAEVAALVLELILSTRNGEAVEIA